MAENFDLIFGQSASQQYAWSDGDYQNGWQTVGNTPPTAEQFDALQRRSDMKTKDLNDRLSPLEEKAEADGRQAATTYATGAMLTVDGLPNGWLLECTVPGISGTDAITLPDTLIDGLTIIDGDVTWALRKVATNGGLGYRQPNTTYTAGQIAYHQALPTGYYLECTTAGITSAGDITPTDTLGGTVSDGDVTWTVMKDLSLSGGDMVGTNVIIGKANDDGQMIIRGGMTVNDSGNLFLYGKNVNNDFAGGFELSCIKDSLEGYKNLIGLPDGRLTWGRGFPGNDLAGSAIVAKSLGINGYIKYASGLILQWGSVGNPNNLTGMSLSFSISFSTMPIVVATGKNSNNTNTAQNYNINTYGVSSNKFYIAAAVAPKFVDYIAIGY